MEVGRIILVSGTAKSHVVCASVGVTMSQHVFAWVAGFGWTLMPYAPFRFERVEGRPRSLSVEHFAPAGAGRVVVTVSDDGRRVRSEPAQQTSTPVDVVELIEGAAFD